MIACASFGNLHLDEQATKVAKATQVSWQYLFACRIFVIKRHLVISSSLVLAQEQFVIGMFIMSRQMSGFANVIISPANRHLDVMFDNACSVCTVGFTCLDVMFDNACSVCTVGFTWLDGRVTDGFC